MTTYQIGRFEVVNRAELARTALGAGLLIGLGEPLMSLALRYVPRRDGQRLARQWARATRSFLDIRLEVDGLENVDADQQYVVTPLHEGFADALILATLPLDLRYVVRDELFAWPQLGRALTATDQIAVRPENRVSGFRDLMVEAERTANRDESLVVFPQGSILGVEAAFQSGPFRIADRLRLPLLPVVLAGTHRVWEHPYSDRLRFGQSVSMRVLEPLAVGEALSSMRETERSMKRTALSSVTAPPRRFDPDRDGYWDGYEFNIDPDYPEVAKKVALHRATLETAV